MTAVAFRAVCQSIEASSQRSRPRVKTWSTMSEAARWKQRAKSRSTAPRMTRCQGAENVASI